MIYMFPITILEHDSKTTKHYELMNDIKVTNNTLYYNIYNLIKMFKSNNIDNKLLFLIFSSNDEVREKEAIYLEDYIKILAENTKTIKANSFYKKTGFATINFNFDLIQQDKVKTEIDFWEYSGKHINTVNSFYDDDIYNLIDTIRDNYNLAYCNIQFNATRQAEVNNLKNFLENEDIIYYTDEYGGGIISNIVNPPKNTIITLIVIAIILFFIFRESD